MISKLIEYIKQTKGELKQVNWPSRSSALRSTFLIIGVSIVVALFLGLLDIIFQGALQRFL